jgi:AraC-like DNA-binding protein
LLGDKLILEAKKLLVNSSMSIKEILYSLNFKDPAYFNKFFKNKAGETPSQFRIRQTEKYK